MLLLTASVSLAGPWVAAAGEGYGKAGVSSFTASDYVDPGGQITEGTQYTGLTPHLYAEVGVANDLQVVALVPFVLSRNELDGTRYHNRGFGDFELGLEVGTTRWAVPVSLLTLVKVPGYDNGDLSQFGHATTRFPALGDGQVDFTVLGATGASTGEGWTAGWALVEAGYRHRTEWWWGDHTRPARTYRDGLVWHAQVGWSPRDLGWFFVEGRGVHNPTADLYTKQSVQVGLGAAAAIADGWAIEAGAATVAWARASAVGLSWSAGLSWKR